MKQASLGLAGFAAMFLVGLALPAQAAGPVCAGASRPIIHGQQSNESVTVLVKEWCRRSYVDLRAFAQRAEIVKPPRLGTVDAHEKYAFRYTSDKVGQDEFTVRIHWVSATGHPQNAVVVVKVNVVATRAEVR